MRRRPSTTGNPDENRLINRNQEMNIETEVKIELESIGDFVERLLSCGASRISERSFEDNILFDFPDDSLRLKRCVLRVRSVAGRGVLTYKGAPQPDGIFKSREELETGIDNPETVIEIFDRTGMTRTFRYQKYRREFAINNVHVAVDETPIGNYAELEGMEGEILNLAEKLGIAKSLFICKSYHALYIDYCRERGITPQSMIF
jgi:adenylate cyclase class 2